MLSDKQARQCLRGMFDAAIESAMPSRGLPAHLPEKPKGRCVVVGAGKASAAMAAALENAWPDIPVSGVVVTRYGHSVPTRHIKVIEAAHPVPDAKSVAASQEIFAAVSGLTTQDLVIALISGGGSSLLVAPAEGVTLADKQQLNRALLASGASIGEMNIVRKQLSQIKGGKLALAAMPARVVTLVISDVPGDDPAIIASGPTVPDTSTGAQALDILARYKITLGEHIKAALQAPRKKTIPFKPDIRMIASPLKALQAAADIARIHNITPLILGDALEGESQDLGKLLTGIATSCAAHQLPLKAPCVLLSGGETTVTLDSEVPGRGGRNTECLLAAAIALQGHATIYAIAGDTDGIDGSDDAAGAMLTPDTLQRAASLGLNPHTYLKRHDSYSFFQQLGDLVITGPTLTNVNDFRAILVLPSGKKPFL